MKMHPKECAKDLIRAYVERGDSLESLKKGQLGCATSNYWANIYGDWIFVTKLGGKDCNFKFRLKNLYKEIQHGEQEELFK